MGNLTEASALRWRALSTLVHYRWPAACALLLAAPLVLVAMPPMADLPGHEAVVGVLRHWGDRSYFPADLYVLNWGHPNQLQYALAWPLSYVLGTTRALELVVALAVAAIILGAARLARHLGRPSWVGMLTAPAAVGWSLHLGLIANLLGMGVLLWWLPGLDRFARAPRLRSATSVLAGLVLLYFAHEAALAFAVLSIVLLSLAHGGGIASYALRAAPCAVATAAAYLQLGLRHLTLVNEAGLAPEPLAHRLHYAPWTTVGYYDFDRGRIAFAFIAIVVTLNAVRGLLPAAKGPPVGSARTARECIVRLRFVALGVAALAGFLFLPGSHEGILFLFHRFLAIAWCLLVVATGAPTGAPGERAAVVACAAVPAAMLALVLPTLLASDASYRRLDALLPAIEKGAAVYSVELDHGLLRVFNERGFSTRFAQGHVVALRGGRALADYTQSPISPVLVNPRYAWDRIARDNFLDPAAFRPALIFASFRYVLVHASIPGVRDAVQTALAREARLVARDSDWLVFESSILRTDAIDVPEPTETGDAEDTLTARLSRPSRAAHSP